MASPRSNLGSPFIWFTTRMFVLLWSIGIVWMLLLPPDRVTPRKTVWSEIFFGVGVVAMNLLLHSWAYGRANESGLQYRQYFRLKFLPWSAFSSVEWSSSTMPVVLRLREGGALSGKLRFPVYNPNPFVTGTKWHKEMTDLVFRIGNYIRAAPD